jgi:hypothetical protein
MGAKDSEPCSWAWARIFIDISVPPMNEVTRVLSAIEGGDPHAAEHRSFAARQVFSKFLIRASRFSA